MHEGAVCCSRYCSQSPQLSPRIGPYGDQTVPTPNLDRLARQGVRYTRAFGVYVELFEAPPATTVWSQANRLGWRHSNVVATVVR